MCSIYGPTRPTLTKVRLESLGSKVPLQLQVIFREGAPRSARPGGWCEDACRRQVSIAPLAPPTLQLQKNAFAIWPRKLKTGGLEKRLAGGQLAGGKCVSPAS